MSIQESNNSLGNEKQEHSIKNDKKFVHIHVHSEASLMDGLSKAKDIASIAKELGCPAVALTDHGTMSGIVGFYDACKKEGIKPILGMEAYITPYGHSRFEREKYDVPDLRGKPGSMRNYYHLILLAKNIKGYENLCALSTKSYAEGYYYKPRIDCDILKEHSEGLVVSSACILGEVQHHLWCGDYHKAKEVALWHKDVFGDDYYLEIMNHGLDMELSVMEPLRRLSKETGIKIIATNDSHYPRKEDAKLQKTMMLLGFHKSWSDADVSGSFFDYDDDAKQTGEVGDDSGEDDPIWDMSSELYIKSYDEMIEALRPNGGENGVAEQELANTLEVAEKCNCDLPIIDPEDMSQYKTPVYDFKSDMQYDEFAASGYEVPQHTRDAIVEELHKVDGNEGKTYDELLSEHEKLSVTFLMWLAEKGLKNRILPKVQQKGEPLPMSSWCTSPPDGFTVKHAHNSPDERWLKDRFAEGKTIEDIMKVYRDRLDYEISIIVRKGFLDYFSIVQDYCNYTKLSGSQIGAGRGSGAGSLVNCLIGITSVAADPITNGLLFERFLSPGRLAYPDIDVDWSQDFRENHLKPYLRNKYGHDHSSAVATYMVYWGKAAIRAAARALFPVSVGVELANDLCDTLDDKPKLDLRDELYSDEPNEDFVNMMNKTQSHKQVVELALQLQEHISGESIHASAFIVAPEKITDKLPLSVSKDERKRAQDTGEPIQNYMIQYDGAIVQDKLGYVKLDLLCLKDLDVLDMVLKSVETHYGCKIDIEAIPLDDPEPFRMVKEGLNAGIFQLDGSPVALRMVQASGADSISDWSMVSALNRPGPLKMGMDKEFVEGKKHPENVKYFCPEAEKVLKDTYGCACFQENLMLLSQDPAIVGFDGTQSDHLRKVIAKKKKDQIEALKEEAREVARSNGADPKVTEDFLDIAEAAGSYSFNASHSLAYALVGYRGAFLKAHFPECFLAAMCTLKPMMKKTNKIPSYLEEARQMGVTVKPPHVNYSMGDFDVPEKGVIAFGLGGIKRVGTAAETIIAERQRGGKFVDFTDFCCRVPREVGKGPIEALIKAGALDGLGWSRQAMEESIDEIIQFRKDWFTEQKEKEVFSEDLFGNFFNEEFGDDFGNGQSTNHEIELIAPFETEYSERELMKKEKEQFGMYLTKDPRDYYQVSRYIEEEKLLKQEKEIKKAHKTGDTAKLAEISSKYIKPNDKIKKDKFSIRIPTYVNISEIDELEDGTPVEFLGNIEEIRTFKTKDGKLMASGKVWDNGKAEESRYGFAPVKYSVKLTFFNSVWVECHRPAIDDVVKVVGRVNIDKEGKWPTAIIVEDIKSLRLDSEWLGVTASTDKMLEYKEAREKLDTVIKELSDPASNRYMIPAIEFPDEEALYAFKNDPDYDRYRGDGKVQISIKGDVNGIKTEILPLKQTVGTVRYAALYNGRAAKIRLPKAQHALDREKMIKSELVSEEQQ